MLKPSYMEKMDIQSRNQYLEVLRERFIKAEADEDEEVNLR